MKINDFGVFIGLYTVPISIDENIKLAEYIDDVFSIYSKTIFKNDEVYAQSNSELVDEYSNLYKPISYNLFGYYDKVQICLVDDFEFSSRFFRPDNIYSLKQSKSFIYQSQTYMTMGKYEDYLLEEWKKINLNTNNAIAIVQLKINTGLLAGCGIKLVEDIFELLGTESMQIENKLILFGIGWNEITILYFGNEFDQMIDIIIRIRDLKVSNLKSARNIDYLKNCFINTFENNGNYLFNSHIFAHTYTTFGYKNLAKVKQSDKIKVETRLFTKPGHTASIIQSFQMANLKNEDIVFRKIIGMGDICCELNIDEYIEFQKIVSTLGDHINKTHSTLLIDKFDYGDECSKEHIYFHSNLIKLGFDRKKIEELHKNLTYEGIPVVISDRVENLFIKFNHAITDPVMFGFFIGLKPLLNKILEDAKQYERRINRKSNSLDRINILLEQSKILEQAFFNRYGTNYDMSEIPDWNVDFSGGFQQLIISYEYAYSKLCEIQYLQYSNNSYHQTNEGVIVYIKGSQKIESNKQSLRLNTFHLLNPELFAAIATHEAANWGFSNFLKFYKRLELKIISKKSVKTILRHFYVDYTTFKLVYNSDQKLFIQWLLGILHIDAASFQNTGEFKNQSVDPIILRVLLITSIILNSEQNRILKNVFKQFPKLYEYYIEREIYIMKVVNLFKLNYQTYLDDIIECIEIVQEIEYRPNIILKENINFCKTRPLSRFLKSKLESFRYLSAYVNKNSNNLISASYLFNFQFYELFKGLENDVFSEKKILFSYRDQFNSINMDLSKKHQLHEIQNDYLFDHLEGVIINKLKSRKLIFKKRIILLTKMWHVALIDMVNVLK